MNDKHPFTEKHKNASCYSLKYYIIPCRFLLPQITKMYKKRKCIQLSQRVIVDIAKAIVETGILGCEMLKHGQRFYAGVSLVVKGVKNSIANFGRLAREGMRETDLGIIRMIIE